MQHLHHRRLLWAACAAAVLFAAFARGRLYGDAPEYLALVYSLLEHGSFAVSPDLWPRLANAMQFDPALHAQFSSLPDILDSRHGRPYFGFALAGNGQVHAIHFGLYSILAAPFVFVVERIGIHPAAGFALLNVAVFAATIWYLTRALPRAGIVPTVLFFALGAVFYLRWSGPEVLTAGAVLAATVAIIRRDWALAILLAGVGGAQNPSVLVLMPAAACYCVLVRHLPSLALLPAAAPRTLAVNAVMAAGGVVLGFAQFAFFHTLFGKASLTAAYFTDPALVSWARLESFFLDLNQGLLIAVPGLVAGLVLAAWRIERKYRKAFALAGLMCIACVLGMAIPTLAAINWNSGGIVINRYAFWAAMPLLALLLVTIELNWTGARRVVVAVLATQALAMVLVGVGHRPVDYVNHTWLAQAVLKAAPAVYNPIPEIMFERSRQGEHVLTEQDYLLWHSDGKLVKVLRHPNSAAADEQACGTQRRLDSPQRVEVEGWEYMNAPIRCKPSLPAHVVSFMEMGLQSGWNHREQTGVWTEGEASLLRLETPGGFSAIRFDGHMLHPSQATIVSINGKQVGRLNGRPIRLAEPLPAGVLDIRLVHSAPQSPQSLGLSADTRQLSFFLRSITLSH